MPILRLLQAPLNSLTPADVDDFLRDAPPESLNLELKSTLSTKGDQVDPWMAGGAGIGDRARNSLLEEVVAFANAEGGTLVLGIHETASRPARPSAKNPIPRCTDLAERLRLQARDCIEPPLPIIDSIGIPLDQGGAGVVVTRIPRSKAAPHRLLPTKECYVRRNDRTEKMTMREIQELVLARAHEGDSLEDAFRVRREEFETFIRIVADQHTIPVQAIKVTLLPAGAQLFLDQIYRRQDVRPVESSWPGSIGGLTFRLETLRINMNPRPILRGVRYQSAGAPPQLLQEIGCSGLVEFQLIQLIQDENRDRLFPEDVLGLTANALLTAERFRRAVGAPEVEYALEVEILKTAGPPRLNPVGGQWVTSRVGELYPNPLVLPRFSVGALDEFPQILQLIYSDLLNAAGDAAYDELVVDLSGFTS